MLSLKYIGYQEQGQIDTIPKAYSILILSLLIKNVVQLPFKKIEVAQYFTF